MESIDEMAEHMRTVLRLMARRARSFDGIDGPTHAEKSVLVWLDEKVAMTPSALAAAQQVRPQTMGQTLDALERRGWIERGPHPSDRRQILISMTPAGRRGLAKGRRMRQAWLVTELRRLPPSERRTISSALGILERFLKNPIQS